MEPLIGVAISLAGTVGLICYALGCLRGRRLYKPCDECASSTYDRYENGYSGRWLCEDRDGCEARRLAR